jgi:membrane associated rhomboid family serine protease
MFLHAGWLHVIGNMLYLWIFGNNVEDRFGPARFTLFYLVCGMAASAAQMLAAPATTLPNLGASGAVAGVLAAYALLYPGAAVLTIIPVFVFIEVARVPAYLVIGFWFVLQLGNGLATLGASATQSGGVAWFAHIGGFAAGLLLTLPAAIISRRRPPRSNASWRY